MYLYSLHLFIRDVGLLFKCHHLWSGIVLVFIVWYLIKVQLSLILIWHGVIIEIIDIFHTGDIGHWLEHVTLLAVWSVHWFARLEVFENFSTHQQLPSWLSILFLEASHIEDGLVSDRVCYWHLCPFTELRYIKAFDLSRCDWLEDERLVYRLG